MKIDGISLIEGASVSNFSIATGTSYPANPNAGELFFRTDSPNVGLYVHDGTAWGYVSTASSTAWSGITGTPTTLSGYGITDAVNLAGTQTITGAKTFDLQIVSSVSTGTAPFAVSSTTTVSNLSSKYFDGFSYSHFLDGATWLQVGRIPAFTGDVTSTGGSATLTLATVNSNVGSFGSTTKASTFTVNAKGLVTAAGEVTVTPAFSSITSTPTTLSGYGITDAQPLDADLTAIAALTGTSGFLKTNGSGIWTVDTATYLTGNQTVTVSGDATGSGTTAITLTLASVGTAGTYTSVTTDSKGRVTAGTNPTTLSGYGITDAISKAGTTLDLNANLVFNGGTVTGIPTPSGSTDVVNKAYVDAAVSTLNVHAAVDAATTTNLTATYSNGTAGVGATLTNSGTQAAFQVDGYTAPVNARILVKNQTTQTQNGIYTVTTVGSGSTNWVLTRATDSDNSVAGELAPGDFVFVTEGTTQASSGWVETAIGTGTLDSIVIGTNNVTYTQFSGAGTYLAGTGLSLAGTTFNVNLGAGIAELPSTEVGVDVYPTGGLMTTTDNSTSSTTTAAQLALTNVGTAGTYKSVTTDAKGRVTAGTNPTTVAGFGLTDAVDTVTQNQVSVGKQFTGTVGIGPTAPGGQHTLYIDKLMSSATTNAYGVRNLSTIDSNVTATARMFQSGPTTATAAFTLSNLRHFEAAATTIGAGSTVTNNIGFYGNVSGGTNNYNFYAANTALNYFGGDTTFQTNVTVIGSATHSNQIISTQANNSADGSGQLYLNGATGNRIDFNVNGGSAPTFTTRSVGTKLVLYPQISASTVDHGIGVESGATWFSVPNSSSTGFKFYAGTTSVITLGSAGDITLSGGIKTAAGSQLTFTNTTSAVNNLNIAHATTTNAPTISAVGTDTNIPIAIAGKGTGDITLNGYSLANLLLFDMTLELQAGANGTFTLNESASIKFQILSAKYKTDSGTISAAIAINGTNVTGLSALALTTTQGSTAATAANTVSVGNRITAVTTSNATAVNAVITLACKRIL
jgi:hypothetical protein